MDAFSWLTQFSDLSGELIFHAAGAKFSELAFGISACSRFGVVLVYTRCSILFHWPYWMKRIFILFTILFVNSLLILLDVR